MTDYTWELHDYDKAFFLKELDDFVPKKIFDAHAHLYELEHCPSPHPMNAGPDKVSLGVFRQQIAWIMPNRHVDGLFFGFGLQEETYKVSNEFVAREVSTDPQCQGLLIVSPQTTSDEIRADLAREGFVGLKVYHTFSKSRPTFNSEIDGFLSEEHVQLADELGLCIMLHMVKDRALADPSNQRIIRSYCESYPNMKLILAHAARGFNIYHTIEGIDSLKGLHNVWFDTSGVTEAGAFEAIVEAFGHEKLLWGSDFPISHFRGRCVAVGDRFVWLDEKSLDWQKVSSSEIKLLFVGMESLRALKLATRHLRLTSRQIEDVFYDNAINMLSTVSVVS
jgi:glutamate-1-semialdehyde 2,1-aminomutase